jgi:hypothetical protein
MLTATLFTYPTHLKLKRLAILLVDLVQPGTTDTAERHVNDALGATARVSRCTAAPDTCGLMHAYARASSCWLTSQGLLRYSHFGSLHDSLTARELVKRQPLNLRLDRLAPLAHGSAKVTMRNTCTRVDDVTVHSKRDDGRV